MSAPIASRIKARLRDKTSWVVVLSFVVLLSVVRADEPKSIIPFDPAGTDPGGTKALTMVLEKLGATVNVGTELRGRAAVLFRDDLTVRQTESLEKWIESGGTLLLADSDSSLAKSQPVQDAGKGPRELTPKCNSAFVRGVKAITPVPDRSYGVLRVRDPNTSCFPTDDGSFMVISKSGRGTIVQIGGAGLFTNRHLGKMDNSVLAANLLLGEPNPTVTFLQREIVSDSVGGANGEEEGDGAESLLDLVPDSAVNVIWQLMLAGLALMLWRGRRLTPPIEEQHAVELPASALTVATGTLLQNSKQADGAARTLRSNVRRDLAALLGVSANTEPQILIQIVADRTRIHPDRLRNALVDRPVTDGAELLHLAQEIEDLHREVAHAR